jgi:hypothetical protein
LKSSRLLTVYLAIIAAGIRLLESFQGGPNNVSTSVSSNIVSLTADLAVLLHKTFVAMLQSDFENVGAEFFCIMLHHFSSLSNYYAYNSIDIEMI